MVMISSDSFIASPVKPVKRDARASPLTDTVSFIEILWHHLFSRQRARCTDNRGSAEPVVAHPTMETHAMKMNDTIDAALAPTPLAQSKVPATSWYALAIMTMIYSCHFLDRSMISIIVEPVRKEFMLRDSQIGLLTGLAYGATFAIAGIPLGLMIDRVARVRLLAVLVAIWSGMTALSAYANSFTQLLIARMGVGASEAGGSPTSLSLISDFFPPNKRSTAVGCFFLSNAVGATASIFIGGFITAKYGWRTAMLVAGVPGLILAIIFFATVREPKRGGTDPATKVGKPASLGQVMRFFVANPAMLHLMMGTAILTAAIATIGAWLPSFGMRFHGLNIKQAGLAAAVAGGFCGAIGSVLGGMLSDRLGKKNPRRRLDMCVAVSCLAVVLATIGVLSASTPVAMTLLSATMLVGFACYPAAFGTILGLADASMRGMTAASLQVFTNLIGYGFGPFMVGVLSDHIGGPAALRPAMALVMGICFPWAALHFWLAARATARMKVVL
jgi:predicted MFS family arabinose efflux permease